MNIVHYIIGLPPKRNGGSVLVAKYLIVEQRRLGHNVLALKCGDTLLRKPITRISFDGFYDGIPVYNLTNPLTPTLIYGTAQPTLQHRDVKIDKDNIRKFVEDNRIQILHLHTLMGLHKDVVKVFRELGVKIVYTTHDFHGLCLHYNLINQYGEICTKSSGEACARCNVHEPSDKFLRLANSSLYHLIKTSGLLRFIKKPKVEVSTSTTGLSHGGEMITADRIKEYEGLIQYYKSYFGLIDGFHFNSSQTKRVYQSFLPDIDGTIIPVLTSGIDDKRTPLAIKNVIRFGLVRSKNEYKGFPVLRDVMLKLYEEGYRNFKLDVFSGSGDGLDSECPNIEYKAPYQQADIDKTFYGMDCMIVPSKCYETFSLVALEALAHGRPVIVSDHVGAKDIVAEYDPDMIYSTKEKLKELLKAILVNPGIIEEQNKKILSLEWKYTMKSFANQIIELYKNIVG